MTKYFFKSIASLGAILIFLSFSSCKKNNGTNPADTDKPAIEQYAADNQLNGQFTSSGLYYVVEVAGTANHPNFSSVITVSYKGYYLDGTVLDQGDLFTSPLSSLIRGWQEGIPYIGEGGKIKLVIPSYLAYNNGVLVFDVTLHYFQ